MPSHPKNYPFLRRLLYIPLLFPLLMILPGLGDFPYPPVEGSFSDITVSHYPAAVTLKRLIRAYDQLPLWSPHLLSGAPLAANPLYSFYYPPAWLALALPLPAAFNLLVILHLVWGGVGMLRLLGAEGLRSEAALLGGLAFAALPKLYAHYGAGHLTLLYAVPWTPWLLLAWRQGGLKLGGERLRAGSGLVLGLIFLADPRWAAYAGLLWLGYALSAWPGAGGRGQYLRRLLGQLCIALLVAAPLAAPLLEFTRLSTRANLTPADNLVYSLPWLRLLGLLFPSLGGSHEFELYPGALVLLLAALAGFWGAVRKRASFWLWAAALSLLWALGENLPGMSWLAALPGFDLLRVPSRALFITGMALAALAAYAINLLLSEPDSAKAAALARLSLPLLALAFFAMLLGLGVWLMSRQQMNNFIWSAGLILVSVVWLIVRMHRRLSARPWLLGCLVLVVIDLGFSDYSLFAFKSVKDVLGERSALADYLMAQPKPFRVYSPSYSLPQQISAAGGLEHVDGVDPLQLQHLVDFVSEKAGTPFNGYSVTLPSFGANGLAQDNRDAIIDTAQLGLLNTEFLVAEYPLSAPGLERIGEFDGAQLYRNTLALPRAWLQPAASPLGEDIQPVAALDWSPNRIEVRLEPELASPAMLVFSEIAYPGWRAQVDGEPLPVETAGEILRAIRLPAGARVVTLSFRPLSVYIGLGLGLLGLGLAFFLRR